MLWKGSCVHGLPGDAGCAAAGALWGDSVQGTSLGLRSSEKLPERRLPLPLLRVAPGTGASCSKWVVGSATLGGIS